MKLIFLDIDGVLNSHRSMVARCGGRPPANPTTDVNVLRLAEIQRPGLDPVAVALLNRLTTADPTVKLVISSTHRLFFMVRRTTVKLPELQSYLALLGVTGEVIGATPSLTNAGRGDEIATWLEVNEHPGRLRILPLDYVILDDDSDMLPEQLPHFVQTDWKSGLSFENFKRAGALLRLTEKQLFSNEAGE